MESEAHGASPGEKALVYEMNTRWIPWYVKLRRQFGLEPLRFNFGPTSHEPLSQGQGVMTFFYDKHGDIWWTLGEKETKHSAFKLTENAASASDNNRSNGFDEVCRTGIESSKPISIRLSPRQIDTRKDKHMQGLPPGEYKLTLLFVEPTATSEGQRVMNIAIKGDTTESFDLDIFKQSGGRTVCCPWSAR